MIRWLLLAVCCLLVVDGCFVVEWFVVGCLLFVARCW